MQLSSINNEKENELINSELFKITEIINTKNQLLMNEIEESKEQTLNYKSELRKSFDDLLLKSQINHNSFHINEIKKIKDFYKCQTDCLKEEIEIENKK